MSATTAMIPDEFICPITMEIMINPLVTRYGHNFEKEAIITWLRRESQECPVTRQPLSYGDMIHNSQLAKEIQAWQQRQGVSVRTNTSGNTESDGGAVDSYVADKMTQIYGSHEFPFVGPILPDPTKSARSNTPANNKKKLSLSKSILWRFLSNRDR